MPTDSWFSISEIQEDVFLVEDPGHVQFYLVKGRRCAALVDTGMGFRNVREAIQPLVSTPVIVLNTHWHFDHIGGNPHFPERGIGGMEEHLVRRDIPNELLMDLYIKPCLSEGIPFPPGFDPSGYRIRGTEPSFLIFDGHEFDLGDRTLRAIATPGHTHGSMSFLDDRSRSLFSGDLVCEGAIYAHFWDSDLEEYLASLEILHDRREDFDRLFVSHSSYSLSTDFVSKALEGFREIKSGTVAAHTEGGWGEPVDRYDFQGFSVLVKPAGSQGVRLFGWA